MDYISANDIITKIGGPSEVARICGITPGAVSQWDEIPSRHQPVILREAKRRRLGITAEQIIMSADKTDGLL